MVRNPAIAAAARRRASAVARQATARYTPATPRTATPGTQPPAPAPPKPEVSLAPGWSIVNGQFVGPDGMAHTDATGGINGAGSIPTAPPVKPFLQPDQQIAHDAAYGTHLQHLSDLSYGLSTLRANTGYNITQIDKKAKVDANAAVDNMIARGLYQSSIKDGELYDIGATAALRKQFLTDALNTATLKYNTDVNTENTTWNNVQGGYDQMAVGNAQSIPVAPSAPTGQSGP